MDLFSYRQGIKKRPDTYQINSISPELKNRLWSCLYMNFFTDMYCLNYQGGWDYQKNRNLCEAIWHYFFRYPIDNLPDDGDRASDYIRRFFLEKASWDEIYSFIEFCAQPTDVYKQFEICINEVLKEEFAGYRLVNGYITLLTDEQEIGEIEKAVTVNKEASEHLKTALMHLSNKKSPDYRNSIKESISAVEVICRKIANSPKATLGDALTAIERGGQIVFHGAEKAAFSKLYGWTSDADGIRHGMMDSSNLDQEDARLMLISCSAFINFLKIKADKAKIKLY